MKTCSVEINGEKHSISEEVMGLMISLSKEKGYYFELLEHTHQTLIANGFNNYTKREEVESALEMQRDFRSGNNEVN